MTDQELLELAALAAGVKGMWVENLGKFCVNCGPGTFSVPDYWDPLEDDGDAFRLALKLKIAFPEQIDPNPCAARRAITRAAAEIGKNLRSKNEI